MFHPLKLNDWPIKKFLILVFSLLLSLIGLVALNSLGVRIPILRELIGFVFLTFIPGFLLLRILRLHNLHSIETVLYSVGSSLSIIMLSGLFIDLIYPLFGIQKPLSTSTLILTLTILTIAFCIICYLRDKSPSSFTSLNIEQLFSPYVLTLLLVPFLSIFGAYVMNVYDSNISILVLLVIVSLFPVLIAFNKIPEGLHGLAIFIVSISVLFHVSLISWHIWGWDIHIYSYWANLTRENLYWFPTIPSFRNQLLLPTILPTIYSVLTDLSLVWFFKLCFPFFFSLVPLGIYSVSRDEFNSKLIPAVAPFVFMFYYPFFETFPFKQFVSELFLVLLIMLVVDRKIPSLGKKMLAILFSFSLIVSHHGVSHFFLLILIFVVVLLTLFRLRAQSEIAKPIFVILFFVTLITWFMFTCGGLRFEAIVDLGRNMVTSLPAIIQSPPHRSGVGYLTRGMPTLLWGIYKYLNLLLQVFIAFGVLKLLASLVRREKICHSNDFAAFSIGFYGFLVSSIIITFGMGFDRTTQITLTLLAPFAVIGCKYIFELLSNLIKLSKPLYSKHSAIGTDSNLPTKVFGIFLFVFFLFSSGFMFEVAGEDTPPYSIALDKNNWLPWHAYYQSEVTGVEWTKKNIPFERISVFNLNPKKNPGLVSEYYKGEAIVAFNGMTSSLPTNIPMYFGKQITEENKVPFKNNSKTGYLELKRTTLYKDLITKSDKIYSGGKSIVFVSN